MHNLVNSSIDENYIYAPVEQKIFVKSFLLYEESSDP